MKLEPTRIHARRKIFFTNKSIDKNDSLIIHLGSQHHRMRIEYIESSPAQNNLRATPTSSSHVA